ncbi:MAG: hypothetical protein ACKO23_07505 [Gemmataceae bacterium]
MKRCLLVTGLLLLAMGCYSAREKSAPESPLQLIPVETGEESCPLLLGGTFEIPLEIQRRGTITGQAIQFEIEVHPDGRGVTALAVPKKVPGDVVKVTIRAEATETAHSGEYLLRITARSESGETAVREQSVTVPRRY